MAPDNRSLLQIEVDRLGVADSQKLAPATEEEIGAFETAFGHQLPADYRWFLTRFGRADKWVYVRVPIKTATKYVGGRLEQLCEFNAISDLAIDKAPNRLLDYGIVDELDVNASEPYVTKLVLISRMMHDDVWALDYRYDAVNPPVVKIEYTGIGARDMHTDALDLDWLTYVAPSFTAMLRQSSPSVDDNMSPNDDDDYVDMTTSPHSDLALDWEAATAAYFEEQCGPLTPRSYMKTQRE